MENAAVHSVLLKTIILLDTIHAIRMEPYIVWKDFRTLRTIVERVSACFVKGMQLEACN